MGVRKYADDRERITRNVLVDVDGCWIWLKSRSRKGYGQVGADDGRVWSTHRLAYVSFVGPIPDGLQLDHLCRNRACCNPEHLEPVTPLENTMRSDIAPAAMHAAKSHCVNGHPFDEANTRIAIKRGRPSRICRECQRVTSLRAYHRARQKAA